MVDFDLSDIVAGTVSEFINYALIIVGILIIYYVIKLIFFKSEEQKSEEKEEAKERKEKFQKWIKKKREQIDEGKEISRKKNRFDPIKGFLIRCIDHAEEGIVHANEDTIDEAKETKLNVRKFITDIRIAWRELKKVRNKATGEEKEMLEALVIQAQMLIEAAAKVTVFKESDFNEWIKNADQIKKVLNDFKVRCGNIINELDKLME